ncbi:cation diffusion facilitator family transporter, partial [Senegalimassilia anaerobia]|uniref:cation diffusion facilitator family transporter n=2 Tax=Coriobacteriaceae TaxID=84107 RepID=UPI003A97D30B
MDTEKRATGATADETAGSELNERRIANKLAIVGVSGNVALSAFKLFAGIFGNSAAMVSDAVHSLSDVFATAIAFLGVRISQRDADESHPYGHERFECLASMALGLILAATGAGIGFASIQS